MQNNIIFFQNTLFGGCYDEVGLFELFSAQLNYLDSDLFDEIQVIVPNQAVAIWLKNKIAVDKGICANLDSIVLLSPLLQKIYLANNPDEQIYDFSAAKYLIYEILCDELPNNGNTRELDEYINPNGVFDRLRAFQLSIELTHIFHEYIYLRTDELLNLEHSNIKEWQKYIWRKLLMRLDGRKTFIDIYRYFADVDFSKTRLKLPKNLFIFGLTSVYPSQLNIICKLSNEISIYWYYQPCSYEYYGDLLSSKVKSRLEQRLLRKPDLNLEDLYLTDGNPLLANLGQQSREFIELLRANDIEVYTFKSPQENTLEPSTLLGILQDDVRNMKYRVKNELRLQENSSFYADPQMILVNNKSSRSHIYDLKNDQLSLKINICHNEMREVQVMFNEIAHILNINPDITFTDILITAPDIDDYAPYLTAVFDNEVVQKSDGSSYKLPYNLTGNRNHKNYKIIETLELILNAPYFLSANYLVEILMQSEVQVNLGLNLNDIELVKKWLSDNSVHFGYDAEDYSHYGYFNYPVHTFKQFLNNLILGAAMPEEIWSTVGQLPIYHALNSKEEYIPYDNLDSAQLKLANQLIELIELLEWLRDKLYNGFTQYKDLSIKDVHSIFMHVREVVVSDESSELLINEFCGSFLSQKPELTLNMPIINLLFKEFMSETKGRLSMNGKICCASMNYVRNLPFKHIYVLGMNFGKFPSTNRPNQLSILASDWVLADRNYNNEDKEAFLDIFLSAKTQIIYSYIGRKETDNKEVKPSQVLGLLINTLGQSFSNFWVDDDMIQEKFDFGNVITEHSLHPFYNNHQLNYSILWPQVSKVSSSQFKDLRWDFSKKSPISLSLEEQKVFYQLNLKKLSETFIYSNYNLFKVLGISSFNNDIELPDYESFTLTDMNMAKELYNAFEFYDAKIDNEQLLNYLKLKGVLGYQHIGDYQFKHYHKLYQCYIKARGETQIKATFTYELSRTDGVIIPLIFEDKLWIEGSSLIIIDDFKKVRDSALFDKLEKLPYALKMKGLLGYLLLQTNIVFDPELIIDNVIIRQINTRCETRDFTVYVTCDSHRLLKKVFAYYVRSLMNPVLIHRKAIEEYAKASKNGKLQSTSLQSTAKARSKYLTNWQNYDLDKIKSDPIFASIAVDYFEIIDEAKSVNDIVEIGKILAELKG